MTSHTTGKARTVATWILRIFVGLAFLGIGIEKLTGTMGTIPFFDAIGWGQWFRYVSGAMDTIGALLIFIPRWTSLGDLVITCTVGPRNKAAEAISSVRPADPRGWVPEEVEAVADLCCQHSRKLRKLREEPFLFRVRGSLALKWT
jgi:hypothetical protein